MSENELAVVIAAFTSGSDSQAEKTALYLARDGLENQNLYNELLKHPLEDVRWWGVRSLAEINSAEAARLIMLSLRDPDLSVRQCAALALQRQPDPRAVPDLIQALESGDPLLARIAGEALISVGTEAVPSLLQTMENGSPKARIEAARALGFIGDTRAVPQLFQALDGDSAILEYWADQGLERMGVGMVFFNP
jgi:HEAT repeat protein